MVGDEPFRNDEQRIFATQLGLITRRQALDRGNTPAMIRTKLARGEWARAAHGVFRATVSRVV